MRPMAGKPDPGARTATAADHMAAAAARRAEGDIDSMRASLVAAFAAARAAGDSQRMVGAALALPTSQRFGVHPGQIPALLHEAYSMADAPLTRGRLAGCLPCGPLGSRRLPAAGPTCGASRRGGRPPARPGPAPDRVPVATD